MLVEITPEAFDVRLDLRYASADNFTGQPVYGRAACYLHADAVPLLQHAIDLAALQGFRLRLFDGFRPSEAQWALWGHTPDAEFLADPRRGSPHSMGAAIDLTLEDARTGEILDMGTGFDDMCEASHHGSTAISTEAQRNRFLLLGIMSTAGWDFYSKEWWHYQLFRPRGRYPVLRDGEACPALMPPGTPRAPDVVTDAAPGSLPSGGI
ncbi:D-alanyl-D-alanine dipeptidase [Phaeovibrio sulfidiphilus]|uniref:D-alanyl-D-alanine dipeptidase n=1 Tax=Phaeovibrio sulfidiphilus TaxID=1220600 RepID=A0A8J6YZG0_9PROT|nr:D-alanyl-D-alanine dipeptidase [Phaeovibrio sulfidiphilus]MBE1237343.1 D-alanyl-D-alanine dipeptidase [Phaeovibrio sulfidiphilus]